MGIEGTDINIVKAIYDKPIANIFLSGEKLQIFPPRSETIEGFTLLFNISLEVIITAKK